MIREPLGEAGRVVLYPILQAVEDKDKFIQYRFFHQFPECHPAN